MTVICHSCEELKKIAELQSEDPVLIGPVTNARETQLQQALAGLHLMIQRTQEQNPLQTMMLIGDQDEFRFYFKASKEETTQSEVLKALGALDVFKEALRATMARPTITRDVETSANNQQSN